MKDMLIPIDKAGRVVLPKDVREELAISPGDLLAISIEGDQLTLRPNREKTGFIKKGAAHVFSTGGPDVLNNELVESIRTSERDGSTLTLSKGLPRRKAK